MSACGASILCAGYYTFSNICHPDERKGVGNFSTNPLYQHKPSIRNESKQLGIARANHYCQAQVCV